MRSPFHENGSCRRENKKTFVSTPPNLGEDFQRLRGLLRPTLYGKTKSREVWDKKRCMDDVNNKQDGFLKRQLFSRRGRGTHHGTLLDHWPHRGGSSLRPTLTLHKRDIDGLSDEHTADLSTFIVPIHLSFTKLVIF